MANGYHTNVEDVLLPLRSVGGLGTHTVSLVHIPLELISWCQLLAHVLGSQLTHPKENQTTGLSVKRPSPREPWAGEHQEEGSPSPASSDHVSQENNFLGPLGVDFSQALMLTSVLLNVR